MELRKITSVVISYHPDSGKRWVNTTVVGIISAVSAMNEDGMCAMIHETNGYSSDDETGIVPRIFALRHLLLEADGDTTPADSEALLETVPVFKGNNFHICFSSASRANDDIAAVLEYDGNATHPDRRVTLREPSDNPHLPFSETNDQRLSYNYAIINTNHYLARNSSIPASNSITRYTSIKDGLADAESDGHVSIAEARRIMNEAGHNGTIHTVIYEPNTLKPHVYFSTQGDGGAFNAQEHELNFADLFN